MENNSIGVIGVGSCGNQLALLAGMSGIPSLAINSASIDLDDIVKSPEAQESCTTLKIGTTEGCGKNRNLAKNMIKQDAKNILEAVEVIFDKEFIKTLVVVGAANNGTGSGSIAILTDILRSVHPELNIIPTPVLPCDVSTRSMGNTLECMSEIINLGMPYIPIDNLKCKCKSIKEIYTKVNEDILADFKIINGDYIQPSSYGNMDEQDRKKLFSTPGMMRVCKISGMKNASDETIPQLILNSIKQNFGAELQGDKIVKRMGVIYSLTEDMLQKIDHSYKEVTDEIGVPIEIFEHINVIEDDKKCSIITILAGLSAPDNRLEEMSQALLQVKQNISKTHVSKVSEYNESVSWLGELDDEETVEPQKINLEDILNKYK